MLQERAPFSAKATNFVQVAYVRREDFLELLREFPHDHDLYCMLRDDMAYGDGSANANNEHSCQVCSGPHEFERYKCGRAHSFIIR